MHEQRPRNERTRCKRHGLVVSRDGACSRCVGQARTKRRLGKALMVVALLTATAAIPIGWRMVASSESFVADHAQTVSTVRLARTPALAATSETGIESASAAAITTGLAVAEDQGLGIVLLPPTSAVAVSPAPPRASVDPEPEATDDARDFELPQK